MSFRSDDGQEKHNKRFPNLLNLSSKSNTEKQWVEKMSCKTLHRHIHRNNMAMENVFQSPPP